jgi:hypothetical protein
MPDWAWNKSSLDAVKRAAHDSVVEEAFKAMGDDSSGDDDSAGTPPPLKLSLRAKKGRCAKAIASPAYLRRVFPDYETTMAEDGMSSLPAGVVRSLERVLAKANLVQQGRRALSRLERSLHVV